MVDIKKTKRYKKAVKKQKKLRKKVEDDLGPTYLPSFLDKYPRWNNNAT